MKSTLLKEKYTTVGDTFTYVQSKDKTIIQNYSKKSLSHPKGLIKCLRQVLLPSGWPGSVSDDYIQYQIWDSAQAFCSGITGILATRAVLVGVGVGNAESKAASATITWILKDGTGMCGRILFAWWKGTGLDADSKKWRLFADILNDLAMLIELIIPAVLIWSTQLLCISTAMKALVGVAGGATRAAITQHQALRGNTGDVAAKDGSQETFVNLCASLFGVFLLTTFVEGIYDWPLFTIFTALHLYANFKAVKSLTIKTLNEARFILLLQHYLNNNEIPNPQYINSKEAVILGCGLKVRDLCNFKIKVGGSIKDLVRNMNAGYLKEILDIYGDKTVIIPNVQKKTIHVLLGTNVTSEDVLSGYFNAVILGIAISCYNNIPLVHTTSESLVIKLIRETIIKKPKTSEVLNLPLHIHSSIKYLTEIRFRTLISSAKAQGWKTETHQVITDEWRFTSMK